MGTSAMGVGVDDRDIPATGSDSSVIIKPLSH